MPQETQQQEIFVSNPATGSVINVKPFFDLIGDLGLGTPQEVASYIENVMDFLFMYYDDSEQLEPKKLRNITYQLKSIKEMFRETTIHVKTK